MTLVDNMTLVARLQDESSLAEYFLQIDLLNLWFKESFLVLNVSKTKEFVFVSTKEDEPFKLVITDQQSVEVVSSFKYLGTIVESKISVNDNIVHVYKKAQQRLYSLGSS